MRFSDTINTGIYILEPEVLEYLPTDEECDFSKDLFPLLLKKMSQCTAILPRGYWCDIGNVDTYRQAQYDALERKVKVDFAYPEDVDNLWLGQNTTLIHPLASLPPY